MAELDPAELASVLDSAQQLLSNYDYDGAYQLLLVAQANAATALFREVNMHLGDACMGLGSLDVATVLRSGLTRRKAEDAGVHPRSHHRHP